MSDLMQLLQETLGKQGVSALSEQVGANEDQVKTAIGTAIPALLTGLSRQDQTGGSSILDILDRDGDGSILDDVAGFLRGTPEEKGGRVVKDVLGQREDHVNRSVSKASGLDPDTVKKLLAILAPILLGAMAKHKQSNAMDADGFKKFLQHEEKTIEQKTGGLLGKLFDQDGDGDVDLNDVAKVAMGQLFGQKGN